VTVFSNALLCSSSAAFSRQCCLWKRKWSPWPLPKSSSVVVVVVVLLLDLIDYEQLMKWVDGCVPITLYHITSDVSRLTGLVAEMISPDQIKVDDLA
jgi:hypothetical protein